MNEIDNKYIDEAIHYKKNGRKHRWIRWTAPAACLALSIAVALFTADWSQDQIELSDRSSNVTVRYTNRPVSFDTEYQLIHLTEEELFTALDTVIFKGKISKLDNIVIDLNGDKEYRAIASIKIEKVYRGSVDIGSTVSVLLPCPIMRDLWVEDTDTVSSMREGMTGIFMPMTYDDTSVYKQNGASLTLRDISDYGFADGERFAFLETENGLIFSRYCYASISDARTLDEIEDHILDMILK